VSGWLTDLLTRAGLVHPVTYYYLLS
jgi:hypothetical protein